MVKIIMLITVVIYFTVISKLANNMFLHTMLNGSNPRLMSIIKPIQ